MVVIITGASAGIGRELAVQLSRAGARLVLAARRADRLEELNAALGGRHVVVPTDVARCADCENLIARAHEINGRIDTLVCNAGYGIARPVAETSADDMQAIFQTNVFGTTDCIRAAVPLMRLQQTRDGVRGQIMIVSSAAARRGLPFFGAYSATKFAQLGLSEALRVELRPLDIAVTSVHPVGTETEFFTVAERGTGITVGPAKRGEVRQSPATVARKMVAAIRSPRPEVWPFAPARFALSLATLLPGVGDRIMEKYRGELDKQRQ
jgi:short-subunit dehydrogenase